MHQKYRLDLKFVEGVEEPESLPVAAEDGGGGGGRLLRESVGEDECGEGRGEGEGGRGDMDEREGEEGHIWGGGAGRRRMQGHGWYFSELVHDLEEVFDGLARDHIFNGASQWEIVRKRLRIRALAPT